MALSRCCCGGLHSVLGEKRCVRTVCTVFALFCTVFALYLHRCFVRCSSCPISTLHCAGWAGLGWLGWAELGWAGVSVLCHREGSFSPWATWRGRHGAHALHTTHVMVARRMGCPCSRVFTMCHAMARPYCGVAHAVQFVTSYSALYTTFQWIFLCSSGCMLNCAV